MVTRYSEGYGTEVRAMGPRSSLVARKSLLDLFQAFYSLKSARNDLQKALSIP